MKRVANLKSECSKLRKEGVPDLGFVNLVRDVVEEVVGFSVDLIVDNSMTMRESSTFDILRQN